MKLDFWLHNPYEFLSPSMCVCADLAHKQRKTNQS